MSLIAALILFAANNAATSTLLTPAEKAAGSSITPAVLRAHTKFLASDLL
jgi:hypothetical protein